VSGDDYVFLANNHFLYEGKTEGKGILKFRVRLDEIVLAEASTAVELRDASAFTDTYEIPHTPLTLATDANEWDVSVGEFSTVRASAEVPWNSGTNVTLLVLGWNVAGAEKCAWRDTMFKRLFWHGYRGRVAAFHWPAQYGFSGALDALTDGPHFDRSEHRAWLSASKAAVLLSELLAEWGNVALVAHSQGNVVASEALNCISYTESQNTNRVTYIALQSAISAQYFDTAFQATSVTNQLDVFSLRIRLAKSLGDLWRLVTGATSPDIQGHFPDGLDIEPPYLHGVIPKFGRTVNFYNRMDYALNIWVANNASKPDNLAYDFSYDHADGGYYRETDPDPATGSSRARIFPASDLRARWCVFSFVAYTRALASGQLDMSGVFSRCHDLGENHGLNTTHYHHSFEFRSNIIDTHSIWHEILEEISGVGGSP
ncbi:MAG: hypothetical protein IJU44_05900, partial [Kiritimatiellae bacterium]|nr:hypothetical protein [Kiritimatiellia bacterium]